MTQGAMKAASQGDGMQALGWPAQGVACLRLSEGKGSRYHTVGQHQTELVGGVVRQGYASM